jgi:hypothetical protein
MSKSQWLNIGKKTEWIKTAKTEPQTREFYHSGFSGIDNENVESFKNGINVSLAKGNGQGNGFYVWVNKKSAFNHFEFIKDSIKGSPMLVTIETELNPEDFDLDHEALSPLTGQFIFDSWNEVFKNLLEGSIKLREETIDIKNSTKNQGGTMTFKINYANSKGSHRTCLSPKTEPDCGSGTVFGSIFNAISQQMPEKAKEFEINAFSEALKNPNAALKYVGTKTLFPTKIECLVTGLWKIV